MAEMCVTENIAVGALGKEMTEMDVTDNISYDVEDEYRIALIGKTGTGKSATGNNILGRKGAFKSQVCGESVTKACQFETAKRFGRKLVVVDTPGLFDTKLSEEEIKKEIGKCVGILSPGPHAFLLVVQAGRFTQEEKNTIDQLAEMFGEGFFKYLIVLFTRKDDLENEETTIHEYVKKVPDTLKDIIDRCGRKYIAFDNTPRGRKNGEDAHELIKMLVTIMNDTGKAHYSNKLFEEAEREFERRKDELLQEEKKKIELERKKIKEEMEAGLENEKVWLKEKMQELDRQKKELEETNEKIREQYRKGLQSDLSSILKEAGCVII